jgi:type IV pilus assembly protein PilQ
MTLQRERPKFLAALLGAATLVAWSSPASADTVRVRTIQVSEAAGNTAVVIAASARPTFTTWKLEQPSRVVIELSGARLGNVDVPLDAGTYAVGLVSASVTEDDSAGPRTKIVLTLRQASDYQVEAKGNDITLHVIPRVRPQGPAQEIAARTEADKLRQELAVAHQETAKARAEANAATLESQQQKIALGQAERHVSQTLRLASEEVENRQKTLDQIAKNQEEQQSRLAVAERLVSERATAVQNAESRLNEREEVAQAARARRDSLARDASSESKAEAATALAEAEQQRKDAASATHQSRQDLAHAVASRRQEESRKDEQATLRRAEASKLDKAPTTPAPMAKTEVEPQTKLAPTRVDRPRSVTLRALSHIRSIDFVDEPSHASVIIEVDDSATFTLERIANQRLSLRIEHSDLPDSLARNLDATEYLGPVKIISSYRDPAAQTTVRVDVDLAEDVPNRVRLDGNRIFWDFQKSRAPSLPAMWTPPPAVMFVPARKVAGFFAMAKDGLWVGQTVPPFLTPPGQVAPSANGVPAANAAPGATPPPGASAPDSRGSTAGSAGRYANLGKKRYTGRRIDLDFKGADIHNILRLLADVGQVNVVVADDVRGEVTIKMRDVPWDQALDVVLRSKGLGSVREGNLLRVAPLALLEKELEAEIARQKQIADVLPIETRLIGVSYADAAQLIDKIHDLLSARGKVSQDHRTNTLIVSDVAKNLQLVEDLVRNLDTQTSQVVIEARIVEASSNFARQIGVQWGGTGYADTAHGNPTGLVFPYNIGIGGGADDSSAPTGGLVPGARTGTGTTGNPNFLVNMPAAAGQGVGSAIGLTMGSVAGAFNLNLRLSAYESTGQVRVLSSPRVTTMDNIEAHIEQGVSIPVSVVSAMGAQTQFVDAKLSLAVKPHVTNEGTISMTITVTNNAPDFVNTSSNGTPTIQKKEAKTTMLVRDGDTAVIGGIYTRNSGVSYTKVPFFSDIPVLGWFFRSRKENDNRSEFLVFITPRIANRSHTIGQ